jgi:hypothetical protein
MHSHTTLILIITILRNKYPFDYFPIQIALSLTTTAHASPWRILRRSVIFPRNHIIFIVVPNCHCDNSEFHGRFWPYCSVHIRRNNPFLQAPITHSKNPRRPSSTKELIVGNLFPKRMNESFYKEKIFET